MIKDIISMKGDSEILKTKYIYELKILYFVYICRFNSAYKNAMKKI